MGVSRPTISTAMEFFSFVYRIIMGCENITVVWQPIPKNPLGSVYGFVLRRDLKVREAARHPIFRMAPIS